jgi:hypothetical protein
MARVEAQAAAANDALPRIKARRLSCNAPGRGKWGGVMDGWRFRG